MSIIYVGNFDINDVYLWQNRIKPLGLHILYRNVWQFENFEVLNMEWMYRVIRWGTWSDSFQFCFFGYTKSTQCICLRSYMRGQL